MALKDLFKRNKNTPVNPPEDQPEERKSRLFGALSFTAGCTYRQSEAMKLSTVARCVNLISDSIAQLPIEIFREDRNGFKKQIYNNPVGIIINETPNARMTRFTFIKTLVQSMLLDGDGYAYIERENGNPIAIHYLPVEYVVPQVPTYLNMPVTYKVTGINGDVAEADMIHLMQYTSDGINGESVIEHAKKSLELAWSELEHAENFFSSGASAFGILKSSGMMKESQKKELRQSWNEARFGGGQMKGVVLLDEGFDYKQIALNPADSQLLESRKFTVEEICRFFNVSPTKAFSSTNSVSYNSLEQENLAFLTNTLQPILTKIELEFERKLFAGKNIVVRFNTLQLSRSDSNAQSNFITKMLSWGVYTINEARQQLNLPPVEDGDKTLVPVNTMTLNNLVKQVPANSAVKTEEEIDVEENISEEKDKE